MRNRPLEEENPPTEEENIDNVLKRSTLDAMLVSLEDEIPLIRIHRDKIKQKLKDISSSSPRPDHPPYAFMIMEAITVLDEKEGSSDEAIAKFIEDHYQYLPNAHGYLVTYHIWELVRKGDIVYVRRNCYRMNMPDKVIDSCSNMSSGKNTSKKNQDRQRKNANEGQYWGQQISGDQTENPVHIEEESECEDQHQSQEHTVPCGNRKRKVYTGRSLVTPKMKHGRKQMVMKHNEVGLKNPAHIENVIEVPEQIKKDGVQRALDRNKYTLIEDVQMLNDRKNPVPRNEAEKKHGVIGKSLLEQFDNEGQNGNLLEQGQFEIHVKKDVQVPNGQENLAAENETETETEKEHVQLDNTVIKDVEMPNRAAENKSVKEHDVAEKELVQVDSKGHSGSILECVQIENTLMEDLQMPNNPENRVAEYEEEKVYEDSDELKKLREVQKSFYYKVRDLYKTMKRSAKENQSDVSADSGPLLFYMGDYKKLFSIVGNVQIQIAEAVVSLANLNVSHNTSWQTMVEENISKEHPLLNSLCLENVRTPSNSKRHCDIETTATTTSELCQKHDVQEKVCFESEMSKGQPASAAPTSVVCAGPDSEQTLQNTDIQGGVTDQTNENDQNQEIPVSERLQQVECISEHGPERKQQEHDEMKMPECENTGSKPIEQGSRLDKSAQEKSKEQELVAASGSLQIKQKRQTKEMKQLASTLRTDYESDLKPSHISAATSDNLGMPLVPCRSTSRMEVKASMREVSQDEKPNLAVENQADHDGVSQSVVNAKFKTYKRRAKSQGAIANN